MKGIFKTNHFARWMKKTGLSDGAICHAVQEMQEGLIDADLGGYVVKKRIALPGRGKSGGVRTLVATKQQDLWIFVYGFSKNEKSNINQSELIALQMLAGDLLALSPHEFKIALENTKLYQVNHE